MKPNIDTYADWYKDKFGHFIYDKNIKSQKDIGNKGTYLGKSTIVETFAKGKWVNTYGLNADGSVVDSFGKQYMDNFGQITITKGHIKIINNYTLSERLDDFQKSWVKKSDAIEKRYYGEKGFYNLGEDLGKASTYVKIGSALIAVGSVALGQPEGLVLAEGVYTFGDGLDNISTGIKIKKDIDKKNVKNVTINVVLSVGNEVVNKKIGKLDGIEKVSEIVTKNSNDFVIDQSKDAFMDDSDNPDSNKIKE